MALVMCSVTDKNMPVMLAVLLSQKMVKMCSFPQIMPKNVLAQSIKAYLKGVVIAVWPRNFPKLSEDGKLNVKKKGRALSNFFK